MTPTILWKLGKFCRQVTRLGRLGSEFGGFLLAGELDTSDNRYACNYHA